MQSGSVAETVASTPDVWFRADSLALSNLDPVTSWADEGTAALTATTIAGSPTYVTNILNGLPMVRFDASSYMATGSTTAIAGGSGLTMLAVIRCQSSGQNKGCFSHFSATAEGWFCIPDGFGSRLYRFGSGAGFTDSGTINDSVHRIIGGTLTNSQVRSIVAGAIQQSVSATAITTANTPFKIGTYLDGSVAFQGDIGEIKIWNSLLSDGQINSEGNALATKWALTWTGI